MDIISFSCIFCLQQNRGGDLGLLLVQNHSFYIVYSLSFYINKCFLHKLFYFFCIFAIISSTKCNVWFPHLVWCSFCLDLHIYFDLVQTYPINEFSIINVADPMHRYFDHFYFMKFIDILSFYAINLGDASLFTYKSFSILVNLYVCCFLSMYTLNLIKWTDHFYVKK